MSPAFARAFQRFLEVVNEVASEGDGAPLRAALEAHLGQDPLVLPVVSDRYASFEHVNVQVALDAWLEERAGTHELVGLRGEHHYHMSLADLVQHVHRREIVIGAVDYVSLADGPSSTRMCVRAGLYLSRDGDNAAAVLLREPHDHTPRPAVGVEVLAIDRDYAARIVADIRRLSLERSVFRNQVISFAASPFGEQSAGPLAFHPRCSAVSRSVCESALPTNVPRPCGPHRERGRALGTSPRSRTPARAAAGDARGRRARWTGCAEGPGA